MCLIALDIKGAFDKVWRNGLCSKLIAKGVCGKLLTWIRSYLTDRSIRLKLSYLAIHPEFFPISASVSQGSILGPLLFSVFIDDLSDECENELYLYADDSTLFCEIKSTDDPKAITTSLNRDLERMRIWASRWKVTFEPSKCKVMTISRKRIPTRSELQFGSIPLAVKDCSLSKDNYRPPTILPSLSKVFETLVHSRVSPRFSHILHKFVFAYRKHHGCDTALLSLTEEWRKELDDRKIIGLVSMDLSKAFDSLPHDLIVKKFKEYGADERTANIIEDYFSDRQQRVKIAGEYSSWNNISRCHN